MNEQGTQHREYGFLTGLAVGSVVGAGLAIWLAPRVADSVKTLGDAVSRRYKDAGRRVTEAVDDLTRKGQGLRDEVFDTVVRTAEGVERGAQDVQRYATDAKTHT